MCREYQVEGVIYWNVICCKIFTGFAAYLKERLQKESGIPMIVLDADQADPRDYSEATVKSRIAAFMEILSANKQGGITKL